MTDDVTSHHSEKQDEREYRKRGDHEPSVQHESKTQTEMMAYLLSQHGYSGDRTTCCIRLSVTQREDRVIAVSGVNRNQAQSEQHTYLQLL